MSTATGFRADLLQQAQQAVAQLGGANRLLCDALRAVLDEVDGHKRPYSTDSYLPRHIVEQVRQSLIHGSL